ncbi:MAG: hypothetical protein IPN84_16740 [Sphingomonadales bacterium]|nr:hypothetical protein [Sphingomonadales bacterium]
MTDYQTETAFSLVVTAEEAALVAEAVALADALIAAKPGEALPSLSPAFAALFPPSPAGEGDACSGFRQLFSDGEYPDFGCEIVGEAGEGAMIRFAGSQVDTDAIAELIRRCCVSALPLRFGWASTCSKYRDNGFGGGTIEITRFDIRDIINPDLDDPLLVLTTSGRDGETLFWNEDAGFGPLAAATVYTDREAERVTVVAADAPEWMSLPRRVPPVHLA